MDLTAIPNPYDFANPVTQPERFFGRSAEMSEIRYYLDHAQRADRPINLALLGDRAAGKTSILNMTEIEARRRGFCAVRIDLDEDDASMQTMFFYKLFDGILTAACELNAFGGLQGKTYETYLNIVTAYNIPDDKLFCPFLFPLNYALAMRAGNITAHISDQQVKHDLVIVAKELNKPVVILFDESNVLSKSRVLLEKLRNIFMSIPGFMLILTGTLDLFPIIDDVFSPIVRQFKKIAVREFRDIQDTKDCVRRPLQVVRGGIEVSDSEIEEIHELSGGRPYEIQLICHLLFRRIQGRRSAHMRLDLGVLEELRQEVERSQDISSRPIVASVKSLTAKQLSALRTLTVCDGRITFEELWNLQYIFGGTGEFTKNQLLTEYTDLSERGILGELDGKVIFKGDYFDKLFAKYYAAEQRVRLNIRPRSIEGALTLGVLTFVRPATEFSVLVGVDSWITVDNLSRRLGARLTEEDVFGTSPTLASDLYLEMIKCRKKGSVPALFVSLNVQGAGITAMITPRPDIKEGELDKVKKNLQTVKARVSNLGGTLVIENKEISVPPAELLAEKVVMTHNQTLRKELAHKHVSWLLDEYCDREQDNAAFHANLAYRYEAQPDLASDCANLGYYFMVVDEPSKSEQLLRRAIELTEDDPGGTRALALYNMGVLILKHGQLEEAVTLFEKCNALLETMERGYSCACLCTPQMTEVGIVFSEVWGPNLLDVCKKTLASIQKSITKIGAS